MKSPLLPLARIQRAAFALALFFAAAQVAPGDLPKLNVMTSSLLEVLEQGGSVYLCTVAKREPDAQKERNFESGLATLTVDKTILGPKLEKLALRYRYTSGGVSLSDGGFKWSAFKEGDHLLCVVAANGQDLTIPPGPVAMEVAYSITHVTGADDAHVKEMEAICTLFNTRNTPGYIDALAKALADPRPGLRGFAAQVLMLRVGNDSPDEVLKIIRSRAAQYKTDADAEEARALTGVIGSKEFLPDDKPTPRSKWYCRCLVTLAQADAQDARECALEGFEQIIDPYQGGGTIAVRDLISEDDEKALRKALARATLDKRTPDAPDTDYTGDLHMIRQWLDGGPASDEKAAPIGIARLTLTDALAAGADVYVCTVAGRTDPGGDEIALWGAATLTVVKTIHGASLQKLSLPYCYRNPSPPPVEPLDPPPYDYLKGHAAWPRIKPGNTILCVVLSRNTDAEEPIGENMGDDGVANEVFKLSGRDDPKVAEMADLCALYKLKNTPGYLPALAKAVADPRPTLRGFAIESLAEAAANEPDATLQIFRTRIARYKTADDAAEAGLFLDLIRHRLGPEPEAGPANQWLCRCLASFAAAGPAQIRREALDDLLWVCRQPGLRIGGMLDTGEKQALNSALTKSEPDFHGDLKMTATIAAIRKQLDN